MIITVQIWNKCDNPDDEELEQEFYINDENRESRARLAKCSWWAMRSGRSITTFAKAAQ